MQYEDLPTAYLMWEHNYSDKLNSIIKISFCMPLVIEVEYQIILKQFNMYKSYSWHADY